jgi:hypothetical protein
MGEQHLGEQLVTTFALDLLYAQIEPPATTTTPAPPAAGVMGSMMMMGMMGGRSGGMMGMGGGSGMAGMAAGMGGTPTAPAPSRWSEWTRPDRTKQYYYVTPTTTLQAPTTFLRIGHSLFSVMFGIMGGLLARRYRRPSETRIGGKVG